MIDDLVDIDEENSDVHQFFNALDTTIDFLSRMGWRVTKRQSQNIWTFTKPILSAGATVIGDASKSPWIMVKSKSGNAWEIVKNNTIDHKVTKSAFKLVKDSSTGAWKLVAPAVKPTGSLIAQHMINIGGHAFKLTWNKSKHAW